MADQSNEFSQPEGNNFDNDFEKLDRPVDPFSPETANAPAEMGDEFVSSTSNYQGDMPEEDLYTTTLTPQLVQNEPLVNFSDEPAPSPPAPTMPTSTEPLISEVELIPSPVSSSTEPEATQAESSPRPPSVSEPEAEPSPAEPVASPAAGGCKWMENLDPRMVALIYWRDVKKTGVVFGSLFVVLLSLALFSVLSVVAYLSLAALTVTISFRVYKNILAAVQKTGDGHPFKKYLEAEIALPEDKAHALAETIIAHFSCALREFRRLFLVEDFVDSIKFGLLLWVLTYIGAWFNGMTLIILAVVGVFTLPKVYETYKVQIDQYLDIVRTQVSTIVKQVQEKLPLPGKKKQQ